jgi:hypothetical protein
MDAMKRNANKSSNESEPLLRSEVLIGSWTVPLVEDRQTMIQAYTSGEEKYMI